MTINKTGIDINEISALSDYLVCNTDQDQELDSIVKVASYVCKTPIAFISFIGEGRQWIKAKMGLDDHPDFLNALSYQKSAASSFFDQKNLEDLASSFNLDIRFRKTIALVNSEGYQLGSLTVMDRYERVLESEQTEMLGILSKAIISYLDNKKRNRHLEKLLAEAQKFQNLFNNSSEIHCITDGEGRIEFISDSIEQLLGFSAEEALGRNIWDFTVAGERERNMPAVYAGISRGEDTFHIETRVKTKSGQEKWFSWSDVIKEGYWLVNGRDISDIKEKELKLQTLSLAVEKSSVGVLIRDGKGEVEWMNSALEVMIGFQSNELLGKKIGDTLVGKDTDLSVLQIAKNALNQMKPYEIEILLYKKDGTPIWVYLSNNQLYGLGDQLEKQVCIAVDITERKEAELELIKTRDDALRLGNAKENFLSIMSHEMRTPLNAVIGITRSLLEENPMAYQMENLNVLKFSSENLLTLINDVLDFTKIETGNLQLEKISFDIKKLVHNTLEALKYKTVEKGVKLVSSIDPRIPDFITGDPTRLYQVFNNLLGNAVKFTEDGEIELKLVLNEYAGEKVRIEFSVTDTGIGIADDKILSIFDAYSQAGSDISRRFGGTGLGLTITKKLIELQGSDIRVKSKLGEGTQFYFTLEFEQSESAPQAQPESLDASFDSNILLVDDNAMNRLLAKRVLNKWNIQPDFAENGAEAIQKIEENNYDLVFMDINMPVLDGLEATMRIRDRSEERFKKLPVIALTASVLKEDQHRIEQAGMNDFLLKPFEPMSMLKVLRQYL